MPEFDPVVVTTVSILGGGSGLFALLLRRWFKMQDDAITAYADGRASGDVDHLRAMEEMQLRHDRQIAELEARHRRDVDALRMAIIQLQEGIAEIIPLVKEEHRLTAVEVMLRISRPVALLSNPVENLVPPEGPKGHAPTEATKD